MTATSLLRDYRRIERAIEYLGQERSPAPTLAQVAANVDLSEFHFQRLFQRWAGISPKRFLQYLRAERAREALLASRSVLDAVFAAKLSSAGRLHDLMVTIHAATPGDVRSGGKDLKIAYGFHASPFGECFIAATDRGVCALEFLAPTTRAEALANLKARWPAARLRRDERTTRALNARLWRSDRAGALSIYVRGTNFQVKVWEALLRIPAGHVCSYEDLARICGLPGATRACASAVANNTVALLIPCHRVIRKTGVIGDYRWGGTRKRALLAHEAIRTDAMAHVTDDKRQ